MRPLAWYIPTALLFATAALANTEKTIFIAPSAITLPDAEPQLDALNLDTLTYSHSKLRRSLNVAFPSEEAARGLDSWYLLRGLNEGQRYEVRICWAAIQPTEFWLNVYNISHVFDSPYLIQSLAGFAELQVSQPPAEDNALKPEYSTGTILFLHVQAAADYFTTNKTLMQHPEPVDVDIILDPYLANVLPVSLLSTAAYIIVLAVVAWFVSDKIASLLKTEQHKQHAD
ncbi:hypothetical protein M409DRAFT_53447 [Zasmidium cellare ATCC 36951]|uniref:Uncharacterized protein n=1 Tax=Zasmidium cellare ATCC 36951 TaxID=1080233 RepID=A0A6A6CLS4_ZASCE|nr:uncharacterized protein M409DRAFT_53447 [Zasmidium cellare ATCC 36951]KAF2168134.1 hypothetical protein M409DRAFT_53447 [Zasmidium cellare ATCC 36951]